MSNRKNRTHGFLHIPKKEQSDQEAEVNKEKLRMKINKDVEEFLKAKGTIEKIPIGASSLSYGLNKKELERMGKKKED